MQLNYHRMTEKTTVFPKIFSTILVLAAIPAAAAGELTVTGEAEKGVPEAIAETARQLVKFFRSPWRNSRTGLTIAFSPAVPEYSAEVQIRDGRPTLMLNGSSDLRRNVEWRRKVYGTILIAAASGKLRSGENPALPPWLTPALDRMLEARKYEERLLVGNRRSPALGALLENDRLPPAKAVRAIDPARLDPAALAWVRELSRALFYSGRSGRKKIASPEYLRKCGEPDGRDPDSHWLAVEGKQEREFRLAARQLAWHALAPRPARWTRKKFAELRKLQLPILDAEGKPTSDFEECDVLELAERLKGRPDAELRSLEFRRLFAEFCPGDSRPSQLLISGFAELVGQAADPPFRLEAKMRRQIELIHAQLDRQEKIDAWVTAEDRRRAPARRACRTQLECIEAFNAASSLLPASARRWIDEREADFR